MATVIDNDKIERHILQIEALKNYPSVVKERNELADRNKNLERQLHDHQEIKGQLDQANKASQNVAQKAIELVNEILGEFEKPPQKQKYREELVQTKIPEQIKGLIDKAIADRLKTVQDEKLLAVFVQEVNRQIEANKAIFTRERLQKAQALQYKNPFVALRGDWKIKCIECNSQHTLHLDFDTILLLLRGEAVEIPTSYSLHRFGLSVKLKDIVSHYLFGGQ